MLILICYSTADIINFSFLLIYTMIFVSFCIATLSIVILMVRAAYLFFKVLL